MEAIRYESSDGLEIPAYLTLPKGVPAKNLPLLVLPHGGPWGRDAWGYNSFAQFFANRGYAVLEPNFRGSTGYGKKFLNAGNRQWGDKMQDDLTWGVKYLVAKGIADPKRIGIIGGSYGGYATLAGVAFTPDLYARGGSIVGPVEPDHAARIRFRRIGKPSARCSTSAWAIPATPEGKAQLQRQSPLNSARQDQDAADGGAGRQRSAREQGGSGPDRDRAARPRIPGRVPGGAGRRPRVRAAGEQSGDDHGDGEILRALSGRPLSGRHDAGGSRRG